MNVKADGVAFTFISFLFYTRKTFEIIRIFCIILSYMLYCIHTDWGKEE